MSMAPNELIDLMPSEMFDTIAVALGVSHRNALGYLSSSDAAMAAYWAAELWKIERVQRALGLEWDS